MSLPLFLDSRASSPHKLFQERMDRTDELYPWRLAVGCVLASKAWSKTHDLTMEVLLSKWPTPKHMAEAKHADLASVLKPLKMSSHWSTIRVLSEYFAGAAEGLCAQPKGMGLHTGMASYEIFVEGNVPATCPQDKALAAWWRWHQDTQTDAGTNPAEESQMMTESIPTEAATPVSSSKKAKKVKAPPVETPVAAEAAHVPEGVTIEQPKVELAAAEQAAPEVTPGDAWAPDEATKTKRHS